jgi:ABC-2 type transport system ATP-binding protein
VLLTTQYLDEADRLADQVAVIDTGRVVAEGTPGDLKAQVGDDRIELALPAGTDLAAAAAGVKAFATGPVATDAERLLVAAPVPARPGLTTEVVRALDTAGVEVTSISLRRPSLDDVFLTLTGHGAADQGSTRQDRHGAPGQTEGEAA